MMSLTNFNLTTIIDQIVKEKKINNEILIQILKNALVSVVKELSKSRVNLDIKYNGDTDLIVVNQFKKIVKKVHKEELEINLEDAKKSNNNISKRNLGELVKINVSIKKLGRIAAHSAKQMIVQKIKGSEKKMIYSNYKGYKNKLVTGLVKRLEKGSIIVDLGKAEGVILFQNQILTEYVRAGDEILTYVIDVVRLTSGPQIFLSRSHRNFISKLFEQEIPEISDGIIKIYNIVREPGFKTKVLIFSRNKKIDPIGACIGLKGTRIKNIMQALKGEKIEVIKYDTDIAKMACNAISPADVLKITIKDNKQTVKITIPDNQLPLAIGNGGKNVKLAMELINWKIDIQSEMKSIYEKFYMNKIFYFMKGISNIQLQSLYNNNVRRFNDTIFLDDTQLLSIFGIHYSMLEKLKQQLQYLIFWENLKERKFSMNMKKNVFNLFLINDFCKNDKRILDLENVKISKNILYRLLNYGYDGLSLYLEDSHSLALLLNVDLKSIFFLQSMLEKIIFQIFSKRNKLYSKIRFAR